MKVLRKRKKRNQASRDLCKKKSYIVCTEIEFLLRDSSAILFLQGNKFDILIDSLEWV